MTLMTDALRSKIFAPVITLKKGFLHRKTNSCLDLLLLILLSFRRFLCYVEMLLNVKILKYIHLNLIYKF